MSAARSPDRASRVLVVVLLVALAVGAAASLILGAATGPSGPPVKVSQLVVPSEWVGYASLAFFGVVIVLFLYQRLTGGSSGIPHRFVVNFLVVLLILLLFLVVLRAFNGAGVAPTGAVGTGGNSTGPPPSPNGSANLTPVTNVAPFLIPALPGWALFAVVAVVVVFAAAVALPAARTALRARRSERGQRRSEAATIDRVRVALEGAARQLDLGEDPREVIVRLYGQFLGRLSPVLGWVDAETPEEIRSRHLLVLGIRPSAAETLTRLFEEARYSSHPLGPDHLARARAAIEAALEDLDRRTEATR